MRWFKHLTAAHDDEAMSELLEEFGAEGYGVWWLIMEMIGKQMDKTNKCFARYSVKKWSKSCQVSAKKFQKTVSFLSKLGKISIKICEKNSDFLIIECRNLLKFRDEYSKKSGQTPDKVRTKSGVCREQEAEAEAETKKQRQKDKLATPNPKIQTLFQTMKEKLAMADQEINSVYTTCSNPEKLAEAVQCALEFDQDLRAGQGKAISDPAAYIRKAYAGGKQSGKTRLKNGDNQPPPRSEEKRERSLAELKAAAIYHENGTIELRD